MSGRSASYQAPNFIARLFGTVILEKVDWPLWLGETEGDVPALLCPMPEGVLPMWPIGRIVGKVNDDGLELPKTLGLRPNPRRKIPASQDPNQKSENKDSRENIKPKAENA